MVRLSYFWKLFYLLPGLNINSQYEYEFGEIIIQDLLYLKQTINRIMNINNNPAPDQNNRTSSNRSKQIIFIIVIYILLVLSSKFSNKNQPNAYLKALNYLKTDQVPPLSLLVGIFQSNTVYKGAWEKLPYPEAATPSKKGFYNFQGSGKSKVQFNLIAENQLVMNLFVQNGEYLDDGYLYTAFDLKQQVNKTNFSIFKEKNSAIVTFQVQKLIENSTVPTTNYKIQKIFNTVDIGITRIDKVVLNFTLIFQNDYSILFQAQVETTDFNLKFNVIEKQSLVIRTIIFAFLAFIISYFTFNAVLKILRLVIQGSQSAQRYSLVSVLVATLWDSILCLVCFIQAFANEENLILFILPSFMLCILFTNLELRWMLSIFQSNNNGLDMRSILCRFNFISYGSFLLVYPILLFTNLNSWLFIFVSLLFLPQLYTNAQKGIRPDLNHPYYSHFLMVRFITIFYIRGFPYNIFELKPDYVVCLICLALLAIQYLLLWVQKIYGPKKIFPKFMLPPIFDYTLHEEINIQVGSDIPECAICLNALHIDPDFNQNDPQAKNKSRLMKTPCNHKYHDRCLKQWMDIKKQCPQCRKPLPPYE